MYRIMYSHREAAGGKGKTYTGRVSAIALITVDAFADDFTIDVSGAC